MAIQREHIIHTALQLLDESGIEGVTLRKLARALNIQAPSLYWHFTNKQALIDAMADALIQDVAHHIPAEQHWYDTLHQIAREYRQAFKAHRDGARVFAGTYAPTENVMRAGEVMITAFMSAGADLEFAATTAFDVMYYVLGFVIEEQAVPENPADLADKKSALLKLAEEKFPACRQVWHLISAPAFDTRFTNGLNLLLAGVEQRLAKVDTDKE